MLLFAILEWLGIFEANHFVLRHCFAVRCLLTVAAGKENVGVAEIVGDEVIVGVKVAVGVNVSVGVKVGVEVKVDVGVGVLVHEAAVEVAADSVNATCSSGEGPHALSMISITKTSLNNFI